MKASSILFLTTLLGAGVLRAAVLPEAQKIDTILARDWERNHLRASPPAPEDVLVRRLYLDIVGRIPTLDETLEFVRSGDPMKRGKLIDRLLASDGHASHMFNYWADLLRLTEDLNGKVAARAYAGHVRRALNENKPYDRFVRDLLSAEGAVWDNSAIGFYTRDENKLDQLAYAVQVFLGTSIVCAQCHNHPFDKWSQMDYYGLAAFTFGMAGTGAKSSSDPFGLEKARAQNARLLDKNQLRKLSGEERDRYLTEHAAEIEADREERELLQKTLGGLGKYMLFTSISMTDRLPLLPPDYKYPDGEPGQAIGPKVLFGHDAVPQPGAARLGAFASWMTSPDNPRFTVVIANRMWKKVFGLGLIEPVDEITDSTVPSNGELMEYLTQLMIDKKYSLKSFLRVLYNTDAYQGTASPVEAVPGETWHFTGPLLRRMSAEQVWDSMVTLARGNVDHTGSGEADRLGRYLADLNLLVSAVRSKGVAGMVEIARRSTAPRGGGREGSDQPGGPPKKAPAEAGGMKKSGGDDVLVALLGAERALELQQGYETKKRFDGKASPLLDKAALAKMSQSERQAAIARAANVTLSARASELSSPERPGHLLRTFGQSDREQISNASDEAAVPQALALLNSPLTEILNHPDSKLRQDMARASQPSDEMDVLYLSLLSRRPGRGERVLLDQVIRERGDKASADVLHALLIGSQFVFVQ